MNQSADAISVETIEAPESFVALLEEVLAREPREFNGLRYFSHPAWTDLAWTRREAGRGSRFLGLVARRGGAVVGWWPLVASRRSFGHRLQNIGQEISDYAEPHLSPDLDRAAAEATVVALLDAVVGLRRRFAFAQFANFRLPAGLVLPARRLSGDWRTGKERDDHFLDATPWDGDWEAYVKARFGLKSRKNMRNEWNVLARRGEVTITRPSGGQFERLRPFYEAWYRYGDAADAARRDKLDLWWRFFERVDRDLLEPSLLAVDGRPASLIFGFRRGTTFDLFSMTFDPELAAESVGKLHLQRVIRAWMERGGRRVDFLVGDEDYKKRLATGHERIATLWFHHRSTPSALLRSLSRKGAPLPRAQASEGAV